MINQSELILEYASPVRAKPLRLWVPVVLLLLAYNVWNWPRLTPTFFPNWLDWATLGLMAVGVFLMARYSSLPRWVYLPFGAAVAGLFLSANFNDNNFRRSTDARDIVMPWSAMIVAGGLLSRAIAFFGQRAR